MKRNKITAAFSSFLVLILLVVSVTGCSPAPKNAQTKTSEPAPTTVAKDKYAPDDSKQYKIRFVPGVSAPFEANSQMEQYWEKKYNVDFVPIYMEKIDTQLPLMFASKDIPDLFYCSSNKLTDYYNQGLVAGIPQETLAKYAPNINKELVEAGPFTLQLTKINNKIIGLPFLKGHNEFRAPVAWRDDWLKNVGINKLPETLAEMEDAMYKFRNNDPDGNGKKDTYGLAATGMQMVFGAHGFLPDQSGSSTFTPFWAERDGHLVPGCIQPEMKDALTVLNKWYKDGVLDPEFTGSENKGGYANVSTIFVNGRIGLSCMGSYYHWKPSLPGENHIGQNYDEFKKANPKGTFAYGVPVKGPKGLAGVSKGNQLNSVMAFGAPLEKEPDKVGKILQMVNFMEGTKEGYITRLYGFEGVNWDMVNGIPVSKPNFTDSKDLSKIGAHTIFALGTLSSTLFYAYPGWREWATQNKFKESGIENKLLVATQSSGQYASELSKLQQEMYIKFIKGEEPIANFDSFVSKWKTLGGNTLTAEADAWYQSMKSTK